jgi:hypothetical protein
MGFADRFAGSVEREWNCGFGSLGRVVNAVALWSGSRRVSLPSSPLGTGRASFPASGSSLQNARIGRSFPTVNP